MPFGKIKFFNEKSGFGFIIEKESGKEIYVHAKDLLSAVKEGDEVEFALAERKRGPVALGVKKKE
jgi:cold shock protein